MIKILFLIPTLSEGGAEKVLRNLVNNMDQTTLLVFCAELDLIDRIPSSCNIIVADREKKISFPQKYKYSKLFHLIEPTNNPSKFHQLMKWTEPIIKWIENKLYIRYIHSFMKEQKYDTAVIYNDVVAEMTIKSINAERYVMFYHHGSPRHVYHDNIAYRICDKIITVSKNLEMELKKFVPQYAEKIISVRNVINGNSILENSQLMCIDTLENDCFNIVTVGRVSHEKGMDIAIRTCAKLVERGLSNIRWWIVGDGPEMPTISKLVSELKMEKYVMMTGMKCNPYPYIRLADIYVQPSRIEAFGLTMKEAMVLGKYVISTDTLGARELIDDDTKGLISKIDSEHLAQTISDVLNNLDFIKKNMKKSIDYEKENQDILNQLHEIF